MADDSAEAYAREQDRLAEQLENGASQEIRIQIPKEPEVNPQVYKDVEPLIYRGFLTVSADINDVPFVFKSLNQHEHDFIRFVLPENQLSPRFWDLFAAYSVFLVDGVNVLPDRDRWLPKLSETVRNLHPAVKAKIVRQLSEVNRRASNAVILTEAYVTEKASRYRWFQLYGMDMTAPAVTGVPGTQSLGLNWAQLIWRALNRIEDMHVEQERDWEHAKFVGSCMAGKGLSKIYAQDTERRRKEKEEQLARKDKLLREVLLGEKQSLIEKQSGAVLVTAKTVDELVHQMERDLRGEKDWHDKVVDEHHRKVREAYEARRDRLEQLTKAREQEQGGKAIFGGTEMKGLSPAEVHERMLRSRQIQAQKAHAQMVWPEFHDEKLAGVMERYIAPSDQTQSDPDSIHEIPPARPRATPFKR